MNDSDENSPFKRRSPDKGIEIKWHNPISNNLLCKNSYFKWEKY